MNTVLVTGGKGQLGTELQRVAWPADWKVRAIDVDELDLTDADAVARTVVEGGYAAVINGGAYTAVDRAESEPVLAWQVNALAPVALAAACRAARVPIVQVSTDYVFDGSGAAPRPPEAPAGPLSVYGASKLGGELGVRTSGARHAIVRTSWVVSAHGNNFVKTMLRLAGERDALNVVDDQIGAPTSARDLAQALVQVTLRLAEGEGQGTYHFVNAGEVSWAGFAREIFRQSARRGGPTAEVAGIPTSDYPTPAVRPLNSRLDTTGLQQTFGIVSRPWQAGLEDILDELLGKPQ